MNLLLLAGIVGIAWQARVHWISARDARVSALDVKVNPRPVPPPVQEPKPEAPLAAKYVDVATKDLFSKDRNPNVVVEAPKVEKPREMPPLPVVYGVLGLPSGTRALMAEKAGAPSMPVRKGDMIGEFKVVSLDPQTVVFNWDGKDISKRIEDLIDRSAPSGPVAQNAAPAAPGPVNNPPPNNAPPSNAPVNNQPAGGPPAPLAGVEVGVAGHSERACSPGDQSPAGLVVDGYRKTLTASPFGPICRWVPAQ